MASPLVAGLCGLVRSLFTNITPAQNIMACIINSADNIDAQNPNFIGKLGSGRINARRAMNCNSPCYASINLGNSTYNIPKTESSGTITTANTIAANNRVTLDATTSVLLQPGFYAQNGSYFNAYIEGCGGNLKANPSSKLVEKNTLQKVYQ